MTGGVFYNKLRFFITLLFQQADKAIDYNFYAIATFL